MGMAVADTRMAKLAGSFWMAAGVAYGAWKALGFHADLSMWTCPTSKLSLPIVLHQHDVSRK